LNLDEKETRRMVLHILELKEIYSDYYFLDENCSFNILFLIEAGRPSLHLVDYYWNSWGYGVIPSDTVNVVSKSGIVSKVLYRPSPVTQIRYLATQLDKRDQKSAKTIAIHGLSSDTLVSSQISREEKRRTLALAEEYLKYRYSRMELRQEEFQEQFFQLADAAKGLGVDSKSHEKIPEPTPPESRYTPAKVDFGLGYREDSPFVEITLRPAYRDLLELEDNSYEASQVKILEVSGRYYEKGGTIKLQEATILNILSLSARDIFFRPISWKLLAGVEQNLFPNGDEDIVFQLSAGGGWSFSHPFWGLFYALIEVDTKLSSRFIDNVAFGPGATIGLLKKVSERWNVGFYGQGIFYELGENYKLYKCGFNQLYELTKNSAIFLNFGTERADSETRTEIRMGWSYYF
ncbi:MAG: DUF4105 domain-containing protein, partial [SAR324 cluster bacterium]|nr:DUF4105 domain-containing protein [SAR324 cluster bacterium]